LDWHDPCGENSVKDLWLKEIGETTQGRPEGDCDDINNIFPMNKNEKYYLHKDILYFR